MIHQFAFAGASSSPAEGFGSGIDWPLTWLRSDDAKGAPLCGTELFAVESDSPVRSLFLDGSLVGKLYSDDEVDYCLLGGLLPSDPGASQESQAKEVFASIPLALAEAGMDFSNVVRTWFYLDRVWDWYAVFNKVRTEFFDAHKVFDGLVPASTGIGIGNPAGAALVCAVLAAKPKTGNVRISSVESPLQCPALDYKSSFSRAVEIESSGGRQLLISGTASIHPDGRTAHPGDTGKQIELTMEVIEAILKARGMAWESACRAIAYFKNPGDAALLDAYCKARRLPAFPMLAVSADICRDDLLFEMELDAESRI